MKKTIIHIAIALILTALAIAGAAAVAHRNNNFSADKNRWYSVRLTGGQVYFGHINSITTDTITLKDAYYLQAYTPPAPEPLKGETLQIQPAAQPVYSVRRPSDDMLGSSDNTLYIDRRVVILWEKLGDASQIVKMIKNSAQK